MSPMEYKGGVIAPANMTCSTCPLNEKCKFDDVLLGGFKGNGPKYIGYRLITDKVNRHESKEDSCTCFTFVEVLQDRMISGQILKVQGKSGELVRVFAQEGEPIERRIRVGINSSGEIVRPQAEIAESLKKAGHKVSTVDSAQIVNWKDVIYKAVVPKFAEVEQQTNDYSTLMMRREAAEQLPTESAPTNHADVKASR